MSSYFKLRSANKELNRIQIHPKHIVLKQHIKCLQWLTW